MPLNFAHSKLPDLCLLAHQCFSALFQPGLQARHFHIGCRQFTLGILQLRSAAGQLEKADFSTTSWRKQQPLLAISITIGVFLHEVMQSHPLQCLLMLHIQLSHLSSEDLLHRLCSHTLCAALQDLTHLVAGRLKLCRWQDNIALNYLAWRVTELGLLCLPLCSIPCSSPVP